MSNQTTNTAHQGANQFDQLPDAAFVPLRTVRELFGCSSATIWRWVSKGKIVKPYKVGVGCTRWNVGELRSSMLAMQKQQAVSIA